MDKLFPQLSISLYSFPPPVPLSSLRYSVFSFLISFSSLLSLSSLSPLLLPLSLLFPPTAPLSSLSSSYTSFFLFPSPTLPLFPPLGWFSEFGRLFSNLISFLCSPFHFPRSFLIVWEEKKVRTKYKISIPPKGVAMAHSILNNEMVREFHIKFLMLY